MFFSSESVGQIKLSSTLFNLPSPPEVAIPALIPQKVVPELKILQMFEAVLDDELLGRTLGLFPGGQGSNNIAKFLLWWGLDDFFFTGRTECFFKRHFCPGLVNESPLVKRFLSLEVGKAVMLIVKGNGRFNFKRGEGGDLPIEVRLGVVPNGISNDILLFNSILLESGYITANTQKYFLGGQEGCF